MKPIKFVLLGSALLIIALTFLAPYLKAEGFELSLWAMYKLDARIIHAPIVLVCAGIIALSALYGVARQRLPRGMSVLALLASAAGAFISWAVFSKARISMSDATIGAQLILAAFSLSGLAALAGLVKVEPVIRRQIA